MGRSANHVSSALPPAESQKEPLIFKDETLTGRVMLDGASFDRCTFNGAVLIYSGGAPPTIQNCSFRNVRFEFQDAAARSLALLKAMSASKSGLREVFKASFPTLFAH